MRTSAVVAADVAAQRYNFSSSPHGRSIGKRNVVPPDTIHLLHHLCSTGTAVVVGISQRIVANRAESVVRPRCSICRVNSSARPLGDIANLRAIRRYRRPGDEGFSLASLPLDEFPQFPSVDEPVIGCSGVPCFDGGLPCGVNASLTAPFAAHDIRRCYELNFPNFRLAAAERAQLQISHRSSSLPSSRSRQGRRFSIERCSASSDARIGS